MPRKPKYSTEEERKEAIKRQKRESATRRREKLKSGEGVNISDITDLTKKALFGRANPINLINTAKSLLFGRKDLPPKVRRIMEKVGNQTIKSIEIRRTPLPYLLKTAINIVSLGEFEKSNPYDKLYHLSIVCQLENGQSLLIEKNEVINMDLNPKKTANTEVLNISLPSPITVNQLIEKTKDKMGDKFLPYNAENNNCQVFIVDLLRANGLNTPENEKFVFQELKKLFDKLPITKKIMNATTNLGSKIDILSQGSGLKKTAGKVLKHLVEHITDLKEPVDKRDFKQAKMLITDLQTEKMKGGNIKIKLTENKISNKNIMPKFVKGSQEAKDHMAKIRGMKKGQGVVEDLFRPLVGGRGVPDTRPLPTFAEKMKKNDEILARVGGRGVGSDSDTDSEEEKVQPVARKPIGVKGRMKGKGKGETYGQIDNTLNGLLARLHKSDPDNVDIGIGASMLNKLRDADLSPKEIKEVSKMVAKIRKPKAGKGLGAGLNEDFRHFIGVGLGAGLEDEIKDLIRSRVGGVGLHNPPSRSYGNPSMVGYGVHHHYHIQGGDIWGDIGNALDPNKNGVAKAFDPNQNGVARAFDPNQNGVNRAIRKTQRQAEEHLNNFTNTVADKFKPIQQSFESGDANKFFTRTLPSTLIHQGIPLVAGALGSTLATALVPEGGPVSGLVGSQIGKRLGTMGADELGRATGYGFKKGSQEAKDHMAKIRAMKKNK